MKTRAVIMAGGEGSRLGVLTAKRTKPAVPFAGKYRIIDFTLSNCVNSGIFDIMILAQYRPHSLIAHISAGGPWDLNRDFTGGVRIFSPYKARGDADWYSGTADAVQQNFTFIKSSSPDLVLILSGDHVYKMNYSAMIDYHLTNESRVTIASIPVPIEDASRFGILEINPDGLVESFVEKPNTPTSNLVNMGVYLFDLEILDKLLWEDHHKTGSSHDFGKDILPNLVRSKFPVYAYPFNDYWVDVGTISSYWEAHMDLLKPDSPINLDDRQWIIHTRTEERPPVWISQGAVIIDSMITDGSRIEGNARVERSILSPGVLVKSGAVVRDSVILTDTVIHENAVIERSVIEKRVVIGADSRIGDSRASGEKSITTIGKNAVLPANLEVGYGAMIGNDVVASDLPKRPINPGEVIPTLRKPYEI